MRSSRAYLLVEILIALALFALCVPPLMGGPGSAVRSAIQSCKKLQMDRLGDLAYAAVISDLYQNKIPLAEVPCSRTPKRKKKDVSFSLPDQKITIELPEVGKLSFHQQVLLRRSSEKLSKDKTSLYYQLFIDVLFDLEERHYRALVQQTTSAPGAASPVSPAPAATQDA